MSIDSALSLGVTATPERTRIDAVLCVADTVESIGRDELLRRIAAGQAVVIDVRPDLEYTAGHLPGAISIPVDDLAARIGELPADVEIVAYCRGPYCVFAHDAVRLLRRHGRRAVRLDDGITEWRLAGHPIAA